MGKMVLPAANYTTIKYHPLASYCAGGGGGGAGVAERQKRKSEKQKIMKSMCTVSAEWLKGTVSREKLFT